MRPMLAKPMPAQGPDYPCLVSTKLDGIRCFIEDGRVYTRKRELMPNLHVQRMLGHGALNGLDGELIVGEPYADDVLRVTNSAVMSIDGAPDTRFYVFDFCNGDAQQTPYLERYRRLQHAFALSPYNGHPWLKLLEQHVVNSDEELFAMQENVLELGYEGLILRRPSAGYEFGRSTDNTKNAVHAKTGKPLKPWSMLKLKRFSSGEAKVVGAEEGKHNDNDLEVDALGLAKRSKAIAGMVPNGVLGKLLVHDVVTGVPFRIGSGFSDRDRAQLWADHTGQPVQGCQPTGRPLVGRLWRYKHFEIGVKDAPRNPVSLGERDWRDFGDPA